MFSSFAFAKKYKGDVQLSMGGSAEEMKAKDVDLTGDAGLINADINAKSGMFEFDVQTWHLFGINDWFSVGFMAGFNTGIGLTTELKLENSNVYLENAKVDSDNLAVAAHVNFLLGPAVGFDLGKVVRFNVTAGIDFGIVNMYSCQKDGDSSKLMSTYSSPVGIGFEGQAKFLPKAKVSPVVSYRVTSDFAKTLYFYDQDEDKHEDYSVDSLNVINNAFTVGISFNW